MVRDGYDEPRGVIVGAHYVHWQVLYQGRPQSQRLPAANEQVAMADAADRIAELRADNPLIYTADAWEVRLWN